MFALGPIFKFLEKIFPFIICGVIFFFFYMWQSEKQERKNAEMLYKIFIKPIGRENFILDSEITDSIGVDKYFVGDITNPLFGKREDEPFDEEGNLKDGLLTQIQFFTDNFIFNEYNIPVSFKQFIYPFIESTQNVTINESI